MGRCPCGAIDIMGTGGIRLSRSRSLSRSRERSRPRERSRERPPVSIMKPWGCSMPFTVFRSVPSANLRVTNSFPAASVRFQTLSVRPFTVRDILLSLTQ